jgi:sugar lactone lactonase YvrE
VLPRVVFALAAALPCPLAAHSDLPLAGRDVAAAVQLPAAPLGQGTWRFAVVPGWAQVPPGQTFGATHGGVALDKAGNIYVSTLGPEGILVFSPDGKRLRTLAPGEKSLHGMLLREEGGREFIYGARDAGAEVVKLTLEGALVWSIGVPKESGFYDAPADPKQKAQVFKPTAVAVAPDGRIYVADGYGASVIHVFDVQRKYLMTIGTRGEGEGQFKTCHGLAIDARSGRPLLLVCDRENRRLVYHDLDGRFVRTLAKNLRRPCAVSFYGDFTAVAELEGRVAILDAAGAVVATLGDNPDQALWAKFKIEPALWKDGIFLAPHGLAFDADGNLFVQDWNFVGRFTKLQRVTRPSLAQR